MAAVCPCASLAEFIYQLFLHSQPRVDQTSNHRIDSFSLIIPSPSSLFYICANSILLIPESAGNWRHFLFGPHRWGLGGVNYLKPASGKPWRAPRWNYQEDHGPLTGRNWGSGGVLPHVVWLHREVLFVLRGLFGIAW